MNAPAADLADLEHRLQAMLPEQYDASADVKPTSMRSAGLKYGDDGLVAWNAMWASFCDLAMAGGPPHKGALLEPAFPAEIDAHAEQYHDVVEEICRGIGLVTDLPSRPFVVPGWVRVSCTGEGMAGWLLRSVTMENVAVRAEGRFLDVPAGPGFRVEKEIKNVITVLAKTCHYWVEHTSAERKREIAQMFMTMGKETPLLEPAFANAAFDRDRAWALHGRIADRVEHATGLRPSGQAAAGWLGFDCPSVAAAIWMMRALVVTNVLSRREGTSVFVPVNPDHDPDGVRVSTALAHVHRLVTIKNARPTT